MPTYIEAWQPSGPERASLDGERLSIGKSPANDLVVRDATASRLHAVIERLGPGWVIRDLGSRNGTFVNGERIVADRALRGGDEIRVGAARLILRTDNVAVGESSTAVVNPAPNLTAREREVLRALCRPLLAGDLLTAPAPARVVADELFLSEEAVKKHLQRLYVKFGIEGGSPAERRTRLANEAFRRGAVGMGDLDR
ncbi:MAG TPA: FHA domain-containing protein [Acidimicrobiales bacterium]|nr:FHA domain-containing protein [Acidimicrobiales bacterium]